MAANYTTLNEALEMFAKIAAARGEQYRALAYRRAIIAASETHYVRSANRPEGSGAAPLGSDLARKVAEYRATGHIRELDALLEQPETKTWLDLDKILGFGPATIRALIATGIHSRADLLDAVKHQQIELSRVQELGLRYFDDLQRKIPREDVSRISEVVFTEIFRVATNILGPRSDRPQTQPRLLITTTGSYRRQAPESNDIDILIAADAPGSRRRAAGSDFGRTLLHQIHDAMRALPGFIDILTLGNQKYSFLFRFRWVIMIDIIYVARDAYFSALVYFTGSQTFNIWMRELCKKKGFSLNQYGLTAPDGTMIQLKSEEHIFEILGIPYVLPANRNKPPLSPR